MPGRENHPVNGITSDQAETYCQWRGGRLPTLAEWSAFAGVAGIPVSGQEKPSSGRLFPWGDAAPDETRANFGRAMDISEVITVFFQTEPIELKTLYRLPETCRLDALPGSFLLKDMPEPCGSLRKAWADSRERALAKINASGGAGTLPVGSFSPAGDTPEGLTDVAGNVWEWVNSDIPCGGVRVAGGAWTSISLERCHRTMPPPAKAPAGLGDPDCLDHLRVRPGTGGGPGKGESASDVGVRCVYGAGLASSEATGEAALVLNGYKRRSFGRFRGMEARFVPNVGIWMSTRRVDVASYKKCVDAGACTKPLEYAPPPPPREGCGCHCPWNEAQGVWAKIQLLMKYGPLGGLRRALSCSCTLCVDDRPRMMGYNYGSPGDPDTTPVNGVTHAQAEAFCRWAGGRLPNKDEWLAAAMARVKIGKCQPVKPFEDMDKNDRTGVALQKGFAASGYNEKTVPGVHEWTADAAPPPDTPDKNSAVKGTSRQKNSEQQKSPEDGDWFVGISGCSFPKYPMGGKMCTGAPLPVRANAAQENLYFRCVFSDSADSANGSNSSDFIKTFTGDK